MVILLSVLAAVVFGAASVFVRISTRDLNASKVAVISLLAGLALFAPITLGFQWSELSGLGLRTFGWLAFIGALQFAAGRQLNYTGVQLAGVSRATPFFGTVPVFASILAVTLTDERVGAALGVGIGAVVAGSLLVARVGASAAAPRAPGRGAAPGAALGLASATARRRVLLGMGAALLASACYGSIQFLGRQVVGDVPPLTAMTVGLAAGTVATLLVGAPLGLTKRQEAPASAYGMAVLAGVASAAGVLCLFLALERGAVVKVSPVVALNPLVSVVLGQVFIRHLERLSWLLVVGIVVMVGGVVVVTLSAGG